MDSFESGFTSLQEASDSMKRADLYSKMLGVLSELSYCRNQFLNNGSLIEIFPVAYYHVTQLEVQNIRSGSYHCPIEKMEQILAFYNAYKTNRLAWDSCDTSVVEDHWLQHFNFANNPKISFFCCKAAALLASGIDAHVRCDLPRALRYILNSTGASPDQLFDDFQKSNKVFETALIETVRDINHRNTCGKLMEILYDNCSDKLTHSVADFCCYPFDDLVHIYLSSDVIHFRTTAWDQAISDMVLKDTFGNALLPQPILVDPIFQTKDQMISR